MHIHSYNAQMQLGYQGAFNAQMNPLMGLIQLFEGLVMSNLLGQLSSGQCGPGGGYMGPEANFGGHGCPHQHRGMGHAAGDFLGGHCHPPTGHPHCGPGHAGQGHHGAEVKRSEGNPDKWYFEHGKYKKEKTEFGEVMTGNDGKTRIEYNKEKKTGYVYGQVEGQWQLQEIRQNWEGKAASPIMLDMDGNNRPDVKDGEWKPHAGKGDTGAPKVRFDLDGDGRKELTEWTGGKDGLLLKLSDEQYKNYQQNGQLEVSGKELYGDQGGKYKDGYEKMQKLSDANHDGVLAGQELDNHYVWQDGDRDGVVDKGEMKTTQEAGITKVNATHNGDYQSTFEMNGEQRQSWDWWPTTWT
ncbi:MAG: hypothetical protein AB7S38_42500 [Vulcanimicrobiota bacterium]